MINCWNLSHILCYEEHGFQEKLAAHTVHWCNVKCCLLSRCLILKIMIVNNDDTLSNFIGTVRAELQVMHCPCILQKKHWCITNANSPASWMWANKASATNLSSALTCLGFLSEDISSRGSVFLLLKLANLRGPGKYSCFQNILSQHFGNHLY